MMSQMFGLNQITVWTRVQEYRWSLFTIDECVPQEAALWTQVSRFDEAILAKCENVHFTYEGIWVASYY